MGIAQQRQAEQLPEQDLSCGRAQQIGAAHHIADALGGVIHHLLSNDRIQHDYVRNYTSASLLVKEEGGFDEGLFTGYDEAKRKYDNSSWGYQVDKDGMARTDPTLQDPSCVYQRLKKIGRAHV